MNERKKERKNERKKERKKERPEIQPNRAVEANGFEGKHEMMPLSHMFPESSMGILCSADANNPSSALAPTY
jgi:hypothetical protein